MERTPVAGGQAQPDTSDDPTLRSTSAAHAVSWLRRTLVEKAGAVLPRKGLYVAYVNECAANGLPPTNNAAFGKLFRAVFPDVGATRLGKRGQNKMHYLNIEWRHKLEADELRKLDALAASRMQEREQRARAAGDPTAVGALVWVAESVSPDTAPRKRAEHGPFRAARAEGHQGRRPGDGAHGRGRQRGTGRRGAAHQEKGDTSPERSPGSPPACHQRGPTGSWTAGAHLGLLFTVSQYSLFFQRETWGVTPLNPLSLKLAALSYLLTTTEGSEEVSPLALSAYTMLSMSSFMFGDMDVSREYYHKARAVLGELFDHSDYDVAAALLPLASWSRFNSRSEAEGRQKEVYCLTLGAQMCEALGAVNDETYAGHIRLLCVHQMQNPLDKLAKAQQRPPYRSHWKQTKLARRPQSGMLLEKWGNIYGPVLQMYMVFMSGGPSTSEERAEIVMTLHEQLGAARELTQTIRRLHHTHPSPQLELILCGTISIEMLILFLLNSPRQRDAARKLIMELISIERPVSIVTLLEMSTNNYLIINCAIDILTNYNDLALLQAFVDALSPFADRYYWLRGICDYACPILAHPSRVVQAAAPGQAM